MKKRAIYFIFCGLLFAGCSKQEMNDVSVNDILKDIRTAAPIEEGIESDLKDIQFAEEYGISEDDIEEGRIYYAADEEHVDRILIVKAKDEDALQEIESALENTVIRLENVWENKNETEFKKINKRVLESRGQYAILIISDEAEKIKEIVQNKLTA